MQELYILDGKVLLRSTSLDPFRVALEFERSYRDLKTPTYNQILTVIERRTGSKMEFLESRLQFHSSPKVPKWNRKARSYIGIQGNGVFLEDLGISFEYETSSHTLFFSSTNGEYTREQSEQIYTAIRNLSLYNRSRTNNNLIHCSGVFAQGIGLFLFVGKSGVGKTDAFLSHIRDQKVSPFCNDRCQLYDNGRAVSWPNYLTINASELDGDSLAAEFYDRCRGHHSIPQLRKRSRNESFQQKEKCLIPMDSVSEFTAKKYLRAGNVRCVFFLDKCNDRESTVKKVEDRLEIEKYVRDNNYETDEVSFPPWHGLTLATTAGTPRKYVDRLTNSDTRFYYWRRQRGEKLEFSAFD